MHLSKLASNPAPPQQNYPSSKPSSHAPSPRSPCQICGRSSHRALDCFHRMDYAYQGRHPPAQLVAMVAHTNAERENETWFADSGANQHITRNLEQLSLSQPYTG